MVYYSSNSNDVYAFLSTENLAVAWLFHSTNGGRSLLQISREEFGLKLNGHARFVSHTDTRLHIYTTYTRASKTHRSLRKARDRFQSNNSVTGISFFFSFFCLTIRVCRGKFQCVLCVPCCYNLVLGVYVSHDRETRRVIATYMSQTRR